MENEERSLNQADTDLSAAEAGNQAEDSPNSSSPSPVLSNSLDANRIVRYIMVIGFHHKHGYQVDYCYPPLEPDGPTFSTTNKPILLPASWKTLPLLCLPDGSHNYDSDTIYFTMPDENPTTDLSESCEIKKKNSMEPDGIKTIFGTACYRQIQADKLLNKTDDITRFAVQKSVCVLSTKPLFGLIRSKLEMITHAYFEELDFSKVKILKLTYDNLNSLLTRESVLDNGTFLGLSARHLVGQFNNNMLVLFKAMLLEKKILFYKSPVRDLCSTIMSMCSLFPGLLEANGLNYSTCDLQLSPTHLEALKLPTQTSKDNCDSSNSLSPNDIRLRDDKVFFSPSKDEVVIIKDLASSERQQDNIEANDDLKRTEGTGMKQASGNQFQNEVEMEEVGTFQLNTAEYEVIADQSDELIGINSNNKGDETNTNDESSIVTDPQALRLTKLPPEEVGFPLQIFTRGSFCLPYLSISYLDLLSDSRIKSFVIGATNFLFKQRKEMYDVIVDMEENVIIINDLQLRKCLSLTTEDLRFMDYLNKNVKLDLSIKDKLNEFDLITSDITKWVGGDEWIRYHFRLYTLYLLKASLVSDRNQTSCPIKESFNSLFIQYWKTTTNNYKIWQSSNKAQMLNDLQLKHPFSSTNQGKGLATNFNDMKLKLSYAVNSSERGRMINQTISGIGKWSIWNNIASAANSASSSITSAANTIAIQSSSALQQLQQHQQSTTVAAREAREEDDSSETRANDEDEAKSYVNVEQLEDAIVEQQKN